MSQFVALIWDTNNSQADSATQLFVNELYANTLSWRKTLKVPGLWILHKGEMPGAWRPHLLEDNAGVIFGQLFSSKCNSDGYPDVETFNHSEVKKILDSRTRHLIDHYWGRYIAIIRDPKARSTAVVHVRGPLRRC